MKHLVTIFVFLSLNFAAYAAEEKITLSNSTETASISTWPPSSYELEGALKTTNLFLNQLNSGSVAPGWDLASVELKNSISQQDWENVFSNLLGSAGKRGKSQFNRAIKTNKFPSGASGDFIAVALVTAFEKTMLMETITLVNNSNQWLLAGYNYQLLPEN